MKTAFSSTAPRFPSTPVGGSLVSSERIFTEQCMQLGTKARHDARSSPTNHKASGEYCMNGRSFRMAMTVFPAPAAVGTWNSTTNRAFADGCETSPEQRKLIDKMQDLEERLNPSGFTIGGLNIRRKRPAKTNPLERAAKLRPISAASSSLRSQFTTTNQEAGLWRTPPKRKRPGKLQPLTAVGTMSPARA